MSNTLLRPGEKTQEISKVCVLEATLRRVLQDVKEFSLHFGRWSVSHKEGKEVVRLGG